MKDKPTIRDVAKLAGVSIATVSRVLSDNNKVKESTKEKVKKVIDEMQYTPNFHARSLAKASSDIIGIVLDRSPKRSMNNQFFSEMIENISEHLSESGKDVLLIFTDKKGDSSLKKIVETEKVDGLILLTVKKDDAIIEYLIMQNTPFVVIGTPEDKSITYVDNLNERAAKQIVDYFFTRKRRNIAFVAGSNDYIFTRQRKEGYIKGLNSHGVLYSEINCFYVDFSAQEGYKLADILLDKGYDAVLCTDDIIAYGIVERANELGIDMKVVGFNNSLLSELSRVPFSSVDIKIEELAKASVECLLKKMNGENPDNVLIKTEFILRE